jgi:hypothetical protein
MNEVVQSSRYKEVKSYTESSHSVGVPWFVTNRSFQPSPVFVGKVRRLPQSGVAERRFTWVNTRLIHKH